MKPRSETYGKVKEAVLKAKELNLNVLEAAARFQLNKRSIRSVSDYLNVKLKPIRVKPTYLNA